MQGIEARRQALKAAFHKVMPPSLEVAQFVGNRDGFDREFILLAPVNPDMQEKAILDLARTNKAAAKEVRSNLKKSPAAMGRSLANLKSATARLLEVLDTLAPGIEAKFDKRALAQFRSQVRIYKTRAASITDKGDSGRPSEANVYRLTCTVAERYFQLTGKRPTPLKDNSGDPYGFCTLLGEVFKIYDLKASARYQTDKVSADTELWFNREASTR
jgi:hypothetical protein